jgi:hypothetical protein
MSRGAPYPTNCRLTHRLNAYRLSYVKFTGQPYPTTCLLGHRLNAFRTAYVHGTVLVAISGLGRDILCQSLSIQDRLNEVPNTLIATVRGNTPPSEGSAVVLRIGSQNATPLFRGTILRVTRVWAAENSDHLLHNIEATDPTWGLMSTLISVRYRALSASAMATDILARWAPGYVSRVQPGLPVIDELTVTNATAIDALVQIAKRIGGYVYCDYDSGVHLYTSEADISPPRPLMPGHKSLAHVQYIRDLTQVVTRAIVEGGGVNALGLVPAGMTVLPVESTVWYAPGGGYVRSGPQRIRYTGLSVGGQSAFAGTGVTPTNAPGLVVGIGSSAVELGVHGYAYTWVTNLGETLPSPLASATLGIGGGPVPVPVTLTPANVASQLTIGTLYSYAVAWSYVDVSSDLTQLTPLSAVREQICQARTVTSGVPAPAAPTLVVAVGTSALEFGAHQYAYTFVTATGETLPSPLASATLGIGGGPVPVPVTLTPANVASQLTIGTLYSYAVAWSYVDVWSDLTQLTPLSAVREQICQARTVTSGVPAPTAAPTLAGTAGTSALEFGAHQYAYTFVTNSGETVPSPIRAITTGPITPTLGAPSFWGWSGGGSGQQPGIGWVVGARVRYAVLYTTAPNVPQEFDGTSPLGPPSADIVLIQGSAGPGFVQYPYMVCPTTNDPRGPRGVVYVSIEGGPWYWSDNAIYPNGPSPATIVCGIARQGFTPAGGGQPIALVTVSGIAAGPSGVTARKVYRTAANATQLKLLATLNDNTTTTLPSDTAADASLGANAPTADGVQVPTGHAYGAYTGPANPAGKFLQVFRQLGATWYRVAALPVGYAAGAYVDTLSDADVLADPATYPPNLTPGGNLQFGRVTVSGIARGPSGVTARKVYRTAANATQLKLLATLNDNTTTVLPGGYDNTPDASLGANAPTVDGVQVPTGHAYGAYTGPADPAGKFLQVFRQLGATWYRVAALPVGYAAGAYVDTLSDADVLADPATYPPNPATGGNLQFGRVVMSGIAPGPSGVSSRKVYRTAANAAQLKLLVTIADNVTTVIAAYDNLPDSSLGANAPTVDTAGVTATARVIPAGSTEMLLTSTSPFSATGGYAVAGNQTIRYTGKTGTAITGIPASGDGAIVSNLMYGTPVSTAPQLLGIPASGDGAIVYPIQRGDPVNLVVIVDDVAAQSALATLLGGGTGIRESLLSDGRISMTEATARGLALLASYKAAIETIAYRSRDPHTRSGASIVVDLPPPTSVHGTFRVQDVTITTFNPRGLVPPTYDTRGSSTRFTFEDLVRQIANTQPPPSTGETR